MQLDLNFIIQGFDYLMVVSAARKYYKASKDYILVPVGLKK